MKTFYSIALLLAVTFLIYACVDAYEYSPNQIFDKNSSLNLNEKNLKRLYSNPADDTITIAFVGDSQRFYNELEDFVEAVNKMPSVDFILLAGDISDFGLLTEFELINERLAKLKKPFIGVVGNHDIVAKGEQVFKRMYGPLDFSFAYQGVKFIAHNTNGREYTTGNVPDIGWLAHELKKSDSVQYFVAVSHMPPFSQDFDNDLEDAYTALFRETPSLLISLHGHVHEYTDGNYYNDGVRYMTVNEFKESKLVLLKIASGKVYHQIIHY